MSILTPQLVAEFKNIILEELRNNGYAPNPADVIGAVESIKVRIQQVEAGMEKGLSAVEAQIPGALTPSVVSPAPAPVIAAPVVVTSSSVAPVAQVAPVAPVAPVIPVAK
jgi:hypothetical protein